MKALIVVILLLSIQVHAQERRSAESWFEDAVTSMNKGRWPDALTFLNKAIAENPGYSEAYATRAIVRERLTDYKSALVDYTLSLELLPDQYEVLFGRAALLYQSGYYLLARDDFRKLLKLPAGTTNTIFYKRSAHMPGTQQMLTAQGGINAQVYSYLGLIELELNNCKQAVAFLDTAIALNNLEADYYVNRALAKQECELKSSLDDFNQALLLHPNHPVARHNLALEAAKQGAYDQAEQQLSEIIRMDSLMLDPYVERAYLRLQQKNYHGALADYNRAIALESSDPEIWLNRGVAKEKLADRKGAYADYTQAIELKPDFVKAWLNRGNLLAAQQRYPEALEDYSVAILYQPDYGVAYYNRAITHYRLNQLEKACQDLKRAEKSNHPVAENMKARFCRNP